MAQTGYEIKVIAPVPYSPKVLWMKDKWKHYGNIPMSDVMDGIEVSYPRYINIPGKWSLIFSTFSMFLLIKSNIDSIVRKFRPQIIHAHTATPDGYLGLNLKLKYNLPLVCSLRGSDIHTYPYTNKLVYRLTSRVISHADQILSVSNALRLSAEKIDKPKRQIEVIYNGCEIPDSVKNDGGRGELRTQLGISESDFAILFVGSIERDKGIYELINSFISLSAKYTHLHLILVGDGPDRQAVQNILTSGGTNRNVHVLGKRSHQEVFQWLKASDLFVLPTYNEGLPNALLEAMACGLPVIATKVGGIPEVVKDGENGILIEAKDVNVLYQAINKILTNTDAAKKMGKTAHALIEQEFSWQNNVQKMIKIYNKLI